MDLKIKTVQFVGTVLGAIVAALIAHDSNLPPSIWMIFGIIAGWVCRSLAK